MLPAPLPPAQLIGWVLRRQRLHLQTSQGIDKSAFVEALRELGSKVDASRLSRWELGRLLPSAKLLCAYEQACSLPTHTLRALAVETHRAIGAPWVTGVDGPVSHKLAHEVLDMALAGADPPSGELLGAIEQAFPLGSATYVSPRLAERIARILVARLDIVQSHDRITNRAAVRVAAGHPRLRQALVLELIDRITRPHVGAINDALEMLLRLNAQQGIPVLVSLLGSGGDAKTLPAAERFAHQVLLSSALDASSRLHLETAMRDLGLIPSTQQSLRPRIGRRPVTAVLERHLTRQGDVALLEDERSASLLTTALWHEESRHRHMASLAMVSGEVSRGLAPALAELALTSDLLVGRRAAMLLEYLPAPPAAEIERAVGLARDPTVAQHLWHSRGHASSPLVCDASVEEALDDMQLASSVIYALAMSRSPALEALATDTRRPAQVVDKATWWLDHGPS